MSETPLSTNQPIDVADAARRLKAILFFPAALAAVAAALLIGSSGPAAHRCAATVRAPATELIVKAKQCRLTLPRTPVPFFAH